MLSRKQIRRAVRRLNSLFSKWVHPVSVSFTPLDATDRRAIATYDRLRWLLFFNPRYRCNWRPDLLAHEYAHLLVPCYVLDNPRRGIQHGREFRRIEAELQGFMEDVVGNVPESFLAPIAEAIMDEVLPIWRDLERRLARGDIVGVREQHWLEYRKGDSQ